MTRGHLSNGDHIDILIALVIVNLNHNCLKYVVYNHDNMFDISAAFMGAKDKMWGKSMEAILEMAVILQIS